MDQQLSVGIRCNTPYLLKYRLDLIPLYEKDNGNLPINSYI